MPSTPRETTYALISLGCPKNVVDSERMAGLLRAGGYRMVVEPEGADFVVVNTCGFIRDAREESYGVIREMIELKTQRRLRGVIVAGCLAQRDKEELLTRFPEIDQLVGVFGRDEIAAAAGRLGIGGWGLGAVTSPAATESSRADRSTILPAAPAEALSDDGRLRITLPHLAYLKIAEGCNRLCSFCTIPSIRGPYVSKPIERVVVEAEELAADGVRELILIAQDTSYYGIDLGGEPQLAELLRQLDGIDGLARIRVMYLYPLYITDELVEMIALAEKVVPYLDLPLQHISDEVLRRMRRGVTRAEIERLLDRLRGRIDGLVLRTTLIAGFPGETERQFEELLEFVRARRFERLGVFAYSDEPGTPAMGLDGKLSEREIQARRDRLLSVQQEIAFGWNELQIGRRLDILIDRDIPGEEDAYVGRSYADAPEIDGAVYVTGENLAPGQIIPSEIVAARGYDLVGVACDPLE